MAINDFKNIEKINQELESTAQLINPADLNIFKTSAKNVSDFGLSKNDAIEFRLYDMSNNLLEQTGGLKVRYIHKDELSYYLKDSLDTNTGEKIFQIDVEKLVFEAGYGNGEFRVSFSFVKNYVGNENPKKKVWIHEVSPSRTEIRVLPLLGKDTSINADLEDRYYSFMDNVSEFRQSYKKIVAFLDKIELNIATLVDDYFIKTFGPKYIEVINKDFVFGGTVGYTNFKNKLYSDFRKSVMHEIDGKEFRLGNSAYGQKIKAPIDFDDFVSTKEFRTIISNRLNDSIEYNMQYIPKKQWPLAVKQSSGQYQPSATLQSLLNTGYTAITKIQSQPDMFGTVGNTSNRTITSPTGNGAGGSGAGGAGGSGAGGSGAGGAGGSGTGATTQVTWESMAPKGPIESTKYAPTTEKVAKADEGSVSMGNTTYGATQTYVEKSNAKDNENQPVIPKDNFDNGGSNSTNVGTRGGGGGGNAGVVSGGGGRIDDAVVPATLEPIQKGAGAKGSAKKGGGGSDEGESFWV